jgi:hypothetical protein
MAVFGICTPFVINCCYFSWGLGTLRFKLTKLTPAFAEVLHFKHLSYSECGGTKFLPDFETFNQYTLYK